MADDYDINNISIRNYLTSCTNIIYIYVHVRNQLQKKGKDVMIYVKKQEIAD